jgi:hypothetical protein
VRARAARLRALLLVALALATAAPAGCGGADPAGRVNVLDARISKERRPTFLGLPIRTGQLILSEAPGPYSFFFAMVPRDFYRFTHAALISVEDGEPWVYDVSGRFKVGVYDRPTEGIVGDLRRQRLLDYCRPNLYCEVYDPPPGVDGEKVAAWLRARAETGVEFDAYFRHDEKESLYCTEFVDEALKAGGAAPTALVPTRPHPSLAAVMRYLAVPPATCLPAGAFAAPERYVGALGVFPSMSMATCYYAAKREVLRRMTSDQRMGNVFSQSNGDVRLRAPVVEYVEKAVHLFDGARIAPSEEQARRAARALADAMFGPCEERGADAGGVAPGG